MVTLEPQKYVVAGTVWMENILLVSGRLVNLINQVIFYLSYFQRRKNIKMEEKTLIRTQIACRGNIEEKQIEMHLERKTY